VDGLTDDIPIMNFVQTTHNNRPAL